MSLTVALNTAKSGLHVTAVQADVVSRNISNADTEGYSRKIVKQVTTLSGGAQVASIDRQVDELLDKLNRNNIAKLSSETTIADGIKSYTDYLGQPADEMSPVATLADLNGAFVILSRDVSDSATQMSVISAAHDMASHFVELSGTLNTLAYEVEMNIRYDVADMNKELANLAKINTQILTSDQKAVQTKDYQDEMDRVINTLSGFMDIQLSKDKNGVVTVLTGGGTELVKGGQVNTITYDPGVGQLYAGDVNITPDGTNRAFNGGSLGGLFSLKNTHIPDFQRELDTVAGGMIESFERVAPLGVAGMGLFTDGGQPFDPANIKGIAGRIKVNTEVDPHAGGNTVILQQGTDPARLPGDNTVVSAMLANFNAPAQVTTPSLGIGSMQTQLVSMVSSQQKKRSQFEEAAQTTLTSAQTISGTRENLRGVNIDDELQRLIVIEKNYAANSKVMTAITQMLDSLMSI